MTLDAFVSRVTTAVSRRRVVASLLVSAALSWASIAPAADPHPLHFVYDAPPECPPREVLESKIRARIDPAWSTLPDDRTFEITIVRESGELAGRAQVRRPGRDAHVREIRAPTCSAVLTALAVFIAIALDPSSDEPEPAPSREPVAAIAAVAVEKPPAPPPRPRPPIRAIWTWSSGVHATVLAAPDAAWGARVYGELVRSPGERRVGAGARLSWGVSDFDISPQGAGEAEFRLRTVRLEGCAHVPVAFFALAPCAAFDVGALSGAAPDVERTIHSTASWVAPGATLRAALSLASWLTVELDGGVLVPIERKSFVLLDPYRFVYRPPPVLAFGGLGASVRASFF